MSKRTYKAITVNILPTDLNKSKTVEVTFDKTVKNVLAVALTTDNEDLVFNASQRLDISGVEILPQDYSAKLLYTTPNVPISDRYMQLGTVPIPDKKIRLTVLQKGSTFTNSYQIEYSFLVEIE
jgi:hypothetical protein